MFFSSWGARFPDMSAVWTPVPQLKGVQVTPVVVGGFVGPIFRSPLAGKLASELSAQVLSTSVPFDAITVKHMNSDLPVFGFGVVTSTADSSDSISEEQLNNFSASLDTFLSSL